MEKKFGKGGEEDNKNEGPDSGMVDGDKPRTKRKEENILFLAGFEEVFYEK